MQILLWLCQNYCIWIRRSFYKLGFRLKCILFIVIITCWRSERFQFQANIYIRGLIKLKTFFKFGPAHSGHWWEINSFTIVVRRWESFCIKIFDKSEYILPLPWMLQLTYYFYNFLALKQAFLHYWYFFLMVTIIFR